MHICDIIIRYGCKNYIFWGYLHMKHGNTKNRTECYTQIFVAPTTETVHLGFLTTIYSRTYPIWFLFTGSYHARRVLYCFALLVYCCSGCRVIQHLERCHILFWMKYMNVMSLVTLLSPFSKISSRKYVESIVIYLLMVYIGSDW